MKKIVCFLVAISFALVVSASDIRYRVAWTSPSTGEKHSGQWSENKGDVKAWVRELNRTYPELNHYVESDQSDAADRV